MSSNLPSLAKRTTEPPVARCDMGYPCLTAVNMEGRVHSGNFMVGGNGGAPGYPVRFLEGYDTSYHGKDTDRGGKALFNLGKTTELPGFYTCCDESHFPPDELALVNRMEFTFDYLDVTVAIPSSSGSKLAGKTYTIRTVYVDTSSAHDLAGEDTVIIQGDMMLRGPGETTFSWCTEEKCGERSRPAKPLQASWFGDPISLGGYPHYSQVAVVLKKAMTFTLEEARRGNWLFTVDFDLTRAAVFATGDLALLNTEADLVKAFDMVARDGGPGAIHAKVNLTKSGLDTASAK